MKKIFLFLLFKSGFLLAQPSTDVYLLDLSTENNHPINISKNPGYDNQPSFWDNDLLLYTRTRGQQTDIVRYNLNNEKLTWLTTTLQGSEYSPLRIDQSEAFSAIRLDTTGLQRLYRYSLNGPEKVLFDPLKIGYHHWISAEELLCTVLVEDRMDLVLARENKSPKVIALKVGRSLHAIPNSQELSFIQLIDGKSVLSSYSPAKQNIKALLTLPKGVQDVAWLPSGELIFGQGNSLYLWDPSTPTGIEQWKKIEGAHNISRLALSPNGKLLALVCED